VKAAASLRECVASAASQRVTSAVTIVLVAGMCVAALLTTGRTVAAEQAVLARIDDAGTRSIVVRSDPAAGVTAGLLDQLAAFDGVATAAGFGPITDVRNAAVDGGPPVPVRNGYGEVGGRRLAADAAAAYVGVKAIASRAGAEALRLHDHTGTALSADGETFIVDETLTVPAHLAFLEPLVLVPSSPSSPATAQPEDPLAVLVVLARAPHAVAGVEAALRELLAHIPPDQMAIETSADLAAIRAAVRGELGTYSRATVLGILAISGVLVAVTLFALVTLRRKDFGRRRALGATRGTIVGLLLVQVVLLALAGTALGIGGSLAALSAGGDPLPGWDFTAAIAVDGIITAMLAAVAPAIFASRRDPLHELRVP
jgi:putative ABC transport system permease protein